MEAKPSMRAMETEKAPPVEIELTPPSMVAAEVRPVRRLTAKEQYRKLWSAVKADKRFCLWTLFSMSLVFAWGYDTGLSFAAVAFPEFRKVYGYYYAQGQEWVVSALWQSLWNAGLTIGQVIGDYAAGQFADVLGRKVLLYAAVVVSLASSFALVFAPNLPVLFASKLLLGVTIGLSTAIPVLYVTENAPTDLRSTVSSLTNMIIVLGFFVASLTTWGSAQIDGVWSFKLAFVITFILPALYLCGLPFFPESPVWYIKKGREKDARKAARRLFGPTSKIDTYIKNIKDELKQTDDGNQRSKISQTSWRAIFSKEHRTRTFVSVLGLQSQNFSGGWFAINYQTYYFELIGQVDPFGLTAISSTLQFLSNLAAVCLADLIPRRAGLIGGGTLLAVWSIIIGGASLASPTNYAANMALVVFMITWGMLFTATLGCYGWAVAQETASQATRAKTISFTLICQQLTGLLVSYVIPYFVNPDQLNWGGRVMFLFVGVQVFILIALYFYQPETKNLTYSDIDILYANKVPPRKFKTFAVVDGHPVRKRGNEDR